MQGQPFEPGIYTPSHPSNGQIEELESYPAPSVPSITSAPAPGPADAGPSTLPSVDSLPDSSASASADGQANNNGAVSTRAKTGCITCRLRKKRCDEGKPKCAACSRLGIECLGYGAKRPKWLRDEANARRTKMEIKERVSAKRASKTKAKKKQASGSSSDHGLGPDSTPPWLDTRRASGASIGSGEAAPWNMGGMESIARWDMVQSGPSPPDFPSPVGMPSPLGGGYSSNNDAGLDDVWRILFPQAPNVASSLVSIMPMPLYTTPAPTAGPSLNIPHQDYLHYYLNNVLPLQFRFTGSLSVGHLVAPLAVARNDVLTSVASLAALHLSIKRNKHSSSRAFLRMVEGSATLDEDAVIAVTSQRESLDRLRFTSASDFTAEDVILSAMFAISYSTFLGGTSKEWREILALSQRCLSAALALSPELTGGVRTGQQATPWQRYPQLVEVMIWMDIISSVTLNRGSRLLHTYRRLLGYLPMMSRSIPKLSMERIMGGDSTTLLAIAETVALSEWKERALAAGFFDQDQLNQRAAPILKLLSERAWREAHFDAAPMPMILPDGSIQTETEEEGRMRIMSDVFYGAANLLLATVIHGPCPRVASVASAIQDIIEALNRLDAQHQNPDLNRGMVFPITLAGCMSESPQHQAFFRRRFSDLPPEAIAFGNTRSGLELMDEVWRRREAAGPGANVDWRETMMDMFEAGIFLI